MILVDDSKTILATAQMALEEMVNKGIIQFATYLNPAELRDALVSGNEDYDLLISDINMAQMSGLDLATELKSHDKLDFFHNPSNNPKTTIKINQRTDQIKA